MAMRGYQIINMSDLISVIVPVYNDEKYIRKCIDCLINQTYSNIEILLVVDGSTDNSYEICREYAEKDNRIIVLYKNNEGTAMARNYGILNASGKFIAFMDTDDYATNDFLEVLYKGIEKTGADISTCSLKEVAEDENYYTATVRNDEYRIMQKEEAIKNLFNDDLYGNFVWNKLFKKELFNEIKFKKINKIEDLAIMYLIFDKANYIVFNSSKLYFYVQRTKSQLHKKELKIFTTKILVMRERFNYIKNKYPNIIENYVEYAKAIIECYPFVFYKKYLRNICFEDIHFLLPYVTEYLSKKEKRKIAIFGMK